MGLFDSLQEIAPPEMTKRKAYNPNDYSSIKGSGLYNALNATNEGYNGQAAQSGQALSQQMGGVNPDTNFLQEQAMRQQLGQLEPMDEQNRLRQFSMGNQNAETLDAINRELFNSQRNQQGIDNEFYGDLLGTGIGAGLGYMNGQRQNKKMGMNQALSQRANMPYGPINNQYSQGF